LVSGVLMPIKRTRSVFPPIAMSMVSPSTTCFTVAEFGELFTELLLQPESSKAYVNRNK
jgi:hypothetical protein